MNGLDEKPHKRLEAWKKAIELTLLVYRMTEKLPEAEKFGLIPQMRRAVVSIASNIAEGAAKNTKKEFIQFLHNAQGSLSELDTQSIICHELGYFSQEDFRILEEKLEHENKLLTGLIKSLKKSKSYV